jgi:TRAP-type C4-dicarboxylate transport system permease small subunit
LKSVKNTIDKILQWLCVVIVALMTFFVTYQVVTRYVFNKPSAVSETIARYLFVWLTVFGGAYVFGKRGHMNLVFIREKFSLKTQTILEILSEFLIAVFAILIMIYGGRIYTAKQVVQIDPSLMFSMAWIYGCLPVGGVLVLFYSIYNELELLKKLKS